MQPWIAVFKNKREGQRCRNKQNNREYTYKIRVTPTFQIVGQFLSNFLALVHLTFYANWHKTCPLRPCVWDGLLIRQKRHMAKYSACVGYVVGGDSSIRLTELSSLINHLNYLLFHRLRRRSASPSGYTPFLSYIHLSCVTFSLSLHERKTRWSGVTIQRTSRGPLKAGSQHSTTLNHARLVLTFHIRWKNSSCSRRILWRGWR